MSRDTASAQDAPPAQPAQHATRGSLHRADLKRTKKTARVSVPFFIACVADASR
jgi:hypothetical protein